ncbi:hypothetical protein GWI33_012953 [Rhynchophorus ferrugineus]|uniref:Uncharacterized protein n=1 Tax=Rhynchophorus ferrugineus TaxID=354439 RepID=A0A834I4P1_RHYFE|nr:hypothetical protein GWI33_012953 [Rhynchophorus ferrugineus]
MFCRALLIFNLNILIICALNVTDNDDLAIPNIEEWDIVKFSDTTYKIVINENGEFSPLDVPIVLQNVKGYVEIEVASDNLNDYILTTDYDIETESVIINFKMATSKPLTRGIDVVLLEARDIQHNTMAKAIVFVFNPNSELNPYRLKFNFAGTDYIILNYHYFKWFLILLMLSGVSILIIELHELVNNYRTNRVQEIKYKELQHV